MHRAVGKLLMGLMMTLIGFSSGLSGLGCAVHDLGVSGIVFFGHSLQKTEVLSSRWVANGAWQHFSSMCRGSLAVSIRLHLTLPDPVIPIAPLIPLTLQF